jgi:hypothetical protein
MPRFGTKGSQVQILSPRLKAADLRMKSERSAAASFSAPEWRRKVPRRLASFVPGVGAKLSDLFVPVLFAAATPWLELSVVSGGQ